MDRRTDRQSHDSTASRGHWDDEHACLDLTEVRITDDSNETYQKCITEASDEQEYKFIPRVMST